MSILSTSVPDDDAHPLPALADLSPADLARVVAALAQQLGAAGGFVSPGVRPVPLADLRAEILALYDPPLRAKATRDKVRQALDVLAAIGVGATDQLTPGMVAKFVASRAGVERPQSTNSLLRCVRTVCNYAVSRRYLASSPFAGRSPFLRETPAAKLHHSADDVCAVLDLARRDVARKAPGSVSQWRSHRLYALTATVAYTGVRKMESLKLRTEDIDLPGRMLLVVERSGSRLKTAGSAAPVPLPDALVSILAEWLPRLAIPSDWTELAPPRWHRPRANPDGVRDPGWVFPNVTRTAPWTGGGPGHKPVERMKRLGVRAGVEGLTFQSLRHTFATMSESRWGLSEALIQRVLRHSSRRTQENYRHADLPNLRAAVAGLGYGHEAEG